MNSGILVIYKPDGISSARVVAMVKRKLKARKVGHTGTLDPFATGVLLCAVNQATRISRFFLGGDKQYRARICLGVKTDTYDRTGQVVHQAEKDAVQAISNKDIQAVVESFKGPQDQVPPAFSALKQNGQPLYKLARQGKMVQKPPRRIEFYRVDVLDIQKPYVDIDVACSGGAYIRSLAYDIGEKLGCGAHLAELCRTASGSFSIDQSIPLADLESMDKNRLEERLVSLADCLSFLPQIVVDDVTAGKIAHGGLLRTEDLPLPAGMAADPSLSSICLLDQHGELLAIVEPGKEGATYNYSCVFSS